MLQETEGDAQTSTEQQNYLNDFWLPLDITGDLSKPVDITTMKMGTSEGECYALGGQPMAMELRKPQFCVNIHST